MRALQALTLLCFLCSIEALRVSSQEYGLRVLREAQKHRSNGSVSEAIFLYKHILQYTDQGHNGTNVPGPLDIPAVMAEYARLLIDNNDIPGAHSVLKELQRRCSEPSGCIAEGVDEYISKLEEYPLDLEWCRRDIRTMNARVVSFGFPRYVDQTTTSYEKRFDQIASTLLDNVFLDEATGEILDGFDLVVIPEFFDGAMKFRNNVYDGENGNYVKNFAALASELRSYVLVPLLVSSDNGITVVRSLLLDRDGEISCRYDKQYPSEEELMFEFRPASPGSEAVVCETEFGRVGMALCNDVNFPETAQALADQRADLIVWPSGFGMGSKIQSIASLHNVFVVTSTMRGECSFHSYDGYRLLHKKVTGDTVDSIAVCMGFIETDYATYHIENLRNVRKVEKLMEQYSEHFGVTNYFDEELFIVGRLSRSTPYSARCAGKLFGMALYREYIDGMRALIDMRKRVDVTPSSGSGLPEDYPIQE